MTHRYLGEPAPLTGLMCRILQTSPNGGFFVVEFANGLTQSCRAADIERLRRECNLCGQSGAHLSIVEGKCQECRG